jgi:hypothetical protein
LSRTRLASNAIGGQMEALEQRHRLGHRAQQLSHTENCGFFHHAYMRDHFGGGSAALSRSFPPADVAYFFSDGQQIRARSLQMPEDRGQVFQKSISSNREATGLFERPRQLQDASFAEVAGEDLHADGQARGRLSAGN